METAPRNLADVLAPITPTDFLADTWGKSFWYCQGQRGRFAGLLPWSRLNRILQQHRLDTPRLRLMREGKAVPADSFITWRSSRRHPFVRIPRLRALDVTRNLRDGATLIIDSVDELHEPLTALSESLEASFHARIQVNMYAGWRTSHGFDLHWDDHDVLILQVSGRKHWKVYPMTREYPLGRDIAPAARPQEPLWEGMLDDGGLLYIPRGWWHVAVPLDEPTLHLTVGIHNPTGVDFLSWFSDRLRTSATVRQDLPRFAGDAERAAYLERMRDAWAKAWTPELLDEYFAETDARNAPRPQFSLPWSAMPAVLPPGDAGWKVKWTVTRPLTWSERNGVVEAECNGRRWRFAAAARPLLDELQAGGACSLDDLCAAAPPELTRATIRAFVKELVEAGLAAIAAEAGEP